MRPVSVMLYAAGFGTRMGALTAHQPKPMVNVAGKPLIDHALSVVETAGITDITVNLHYLGEQIEQHLQRRSIKFSYEIPQILDTGGGLKAAAKHLGKTPVITLNTDAVWTGQNPIKQLLAAWDPARMDALLLLLPQDQALGHNGTGDFLLDDTNRITRAKGAKAPVYLGAQILKTELVFDFSETVFSLNTIWDQMIEQGRAYGILHQGGWCDVGRPEGIALAESLLHV
ncbi:nucleotidyltransferase family protein [Cypionkella sp.]|jgi:N-acetyl-alpha-D-muramate 1-phosphate uridylyltransferase|uniref:nucleotidyltransferase family protein n=1 Tax=Cypionkella sp. TaxID=2811411 RepID=UPI002FDD83D5